VPIPPSKNITTSPKPIKSHILTFFSPFNHQQTQPRIQLKPDATVEEKLDEIRERILQMNPAQRNIQLDAISRLLDGSGTVVDIKLPKKAPQGRGRPKGASNKAKSHKSTTGATFKPKSTASTTNNAKSTTRDPSAFEYVEKKGRGKL
jgi:hypothetical protein